MNLDKPKQPYYKSLNLSIREAHEQRIAREKLRKEFDRMDRINRLVRIAFYLAMAGLAMIILVSLPDFVTIILNVINGDHSQ